MENAYKITLNCSRIERKNHVAPCTWSWAEIFREFRLRRNSLFSCMEIIISLLSWQQATSRRWLNIFIIINVYLFRLGARNIYSCHMTGCLALWKHLRWAFGGRDERSTKNAMSSKSVCNSIRSLSLAPRLTPHKYVRITRDAWNQQQQSCNVILEGN